MPSSFDDDVYVPELLNWVDRANIIFSDFRQDNRMAKLKRLIMQDPLVPLGCALTVAALLGATRAMKRNDHHTANKMFRRRIYAQGFTILAIVVGSSYFNKDKEARKKDIENEKERTRREKREKWLAELDFRDAEEREMKAEREMRRKARIEERERGESGEGYVTMERQGEGKVTEAVKGLMWSKDGSESADRNR